MSPTRKTRKTASLPPSAPELAAASDPPDAALPALRDVSFAILHLERVVDMIYARVLEAQGDEFTRLAGALARVTAVLLNGHRILSLLHSGAAPMEDALRELKSLDFSED
jgi:hypothetical protein